MCRSSHCITRRVGFCADVATSSCENCRGLLLHSRKWHVERRRNFLPSIARAAKVASQLLKLVLAATVRAIVAILLALVVEYILIGSTAVAADAHMTVLRYRLTVCTSARGLTHSWLDASGHNST